MGRVFQRLQAILRFAIADDLIKIDATHLLTPRHAIRTRRADLPSVARSLRTTDRRVFEPLSTGGYCSFS